MSKMSLKKHICKSENFKHVYKYMDVYTKEEVWRGLVLKTSKNFKTEREAAVYVDTVLLNRGKKAVNILKAKLCKI